MKGNIPTGREPPNEAVKKKNITKNYCFNFDKTGHYLTETPGHFSIEIYNVG